MKPTVTPWNGEPGILCLPSVHNVPEMGEKTPGTVMDNCQCCGEEVWIAPLAAKFLKDNPQMAATCTACALRMGGNLTTGIQ